MEVRLQLGEITVALKLILRKTKLRNSSFRKYNFLIVVGYMSSKNVIFTNFRLPQFLMLANTIRKKILGKKKFGAPIKKVLFFLATNLQK